MNRLLLLLCAWPVPAAASAGDPPSISSGRELPLREIPLTTLEGRSVRLAELVQDEFLVLCYTEVGCPIASKYAGRLTKLAQRFSARGVRFFGIDASTHDSLEEIAQESLELGRGFPVLKDPDQELTRRLGARTTTEVFVFDRTGRLRYRGAVDDQYSLGAARPAPTKEYLVQALEALLAGNSPTPDSTPAPGCMITLLVDTDLPEPLTWSRDVAPIVQRRCEACHRPGQVAPFALQNYDDVKGRSKMILKMVQEGRMPPWNADHRYDGVFANERRLLPEEKKKLLSWIADGLPRGNPSEDPGPMSWPAGWSIGEPDVVLAMERDMDTDQPLPAVGYAVPREGVVEYQYFTCKTDYPEDRWIRAIEVRAGATDVVHHVLILLDDPSQAGSGIDFRSYFAVAVPGDTPSVYPEGYGKRLPAGATLIFQLHYTPNGKERFDRSSVAIRFWEEPPEFEVVTDAVVNDQFQIPPGAKDHEVRGTRVFSADTGLVSLFPHMHTRGKDFRYVAHYPDGTESELLFSHYDFNWQESYLLPDPLPIPGGTKLECVGHFDNSAENPNNPDPQATVEWGEQTFEEMFIGYYDTVQPVE